MPKVPKQHRTSELEKLVSSKPLNTDLVGFDKTTSNNPSPKSSTHLNKQATPIYDARYYEAFDYCVVFPATMKKPDAAVSAAKAKSLILKVLRSREGYREEFDNPKSLDKCYGLRPKDIEKDTTKGQLHSLFLHQFKLVLDKIGCITDETTSKDGSKIFFRIKFKEDAAKSQADLRNYPLQMAREVTQFSHFKEDPAFFAPFVPYERSVERTRRNGNAVDTIGHVWQRFDRLSRPYNKPNFEKSDVELSMFRDVDRVRLFQRSIHEYLNLEILEEKKYISNAYPLHQPAALDALKHEWGTIRKIYTWSQPLDQIRDYYGEKLALYYSWLGSYCEALTIPAAAGTCLFIVEKVFDRNLEFNQRWLNWCRLFYCIILGSWATFFLQRTLRKEKELQLKWGVEVVTGASCAPVESPWWTPDSHVVSEIVPGQYTTALSPNKKYMRRIISTIITFVLGGAILCVVNDEAFEAFLKSVKVLRPDALSWEEKLKSATEPLVSNSARNIIFMAFLPVVFLVKLMGKLWDMLIIQMLAKFENNKYFKDYYSSLVKKSFSLKFLSHLIPILYLAFLKETFSGGCDDMEDGRCIRSTRHMLQSFFVTGLILNSVEVLKPFIVSSIKTKGILGFFKPSDPKTRGPYFQAQSTQCHYHTRHQFKDFQEVMLNFSFVCLFGVVFPILPLFAFVAAMIEIRTDAYSLTRFHQRVNPEEADINRTWNLVQRVITFAGVVVNVLLCGLVTVGYNHTLIFKLCFSLLALLVVLSFKEFITFRVPIESKLYRTQKARCHVVTFEAIWGQKEIKHKVPPYAS